MAISIQAHRAIMPFVSEADSAQLMATAPHIIPEIIDCLRFSLKEKDHYSRKYIQQWIPAKGILQLLSQMAASNERCADKMVELGLLPLLLSSIQCDPNIHYWSARRAAECLWTIVQVGKGKNVPAVRDLMGIQLSISYFQIFISG